MKKSTVTFILSALFFVVLIFLFVTFFSIHKECSNKDSALPSLSIVVQTDSTLSFRGVSCVFDSIIWVSGSKSTVGKSVDAGESWVFTKIPGIDSLQYRDIHVFDENKVVVMSSGYPTHIFFSADGGENWNLAFASDDELMFLDGMDFWPDGSGIAYGDPVDGIWKILKTSDFGQSWFVDSVNAPPAIDGEAGFAASGSGIVCGDDSLVLFGSGGTAARVNISTNQGKSWDVNLTPLAAGSPSQGVFSISYHQNWRLAVGGDYARDTLKGNCAAVYSTITGNWQLLSDLPYQSAVQIINDSVAVSVGTPGCYVTRDQGKTWQQFSIQGMHTLSRPNGEGILYCAGANGVIGKIIFPSAE